MTESPPQSLEALLPDRHTQHDLFICDVSDAVLKDIIPQMEHPFYSLSKRPVTTIREYEHNGSWLKIIPSAKGLATIYDKDILIYCISQIMAKLNLGEPVSPRVRINSRELLIFTNRGTAGKDYIALNDALDRLAGTRISTNIAAGVDEEEIRNFGLVENTTIRRKKGEDGRLLWCEVELSDWVFQAIRSHAVLTLHRDYFRLRKPIERRIYEIARKHCGLQREWTVSIEVLLKKSGARLKDSHALKEFRRALRHLAENNHLPDYLVEMEADRVRFTNRSTMKRDKAGAMWISAITLDPDTYEEAREAAPGWDVYVLEQEWREWLADTGKEPPRKPDFAFVRFCAKRYERDGRP